MPLERAPLCKLAIRRALLAAALLLFVAAPTAGARPPKRPGPRQTRTARATRRKASPTEVLLGDAVVGSQRDSLPAGRLEAFRFRAHASGMAGRIRLYISHPTTATTVLVGIYGDRGGQPGELLSQGSIASPTEGAWNTLALTPRRLVSGRIYWLAVLGENGTLHLRARLRGRCHSSTNAGTGQHTLPASWSEGGAHVRTRCPISVYAIAASLTHGADRPMAVDFPPGQGSPLAPTSPTSAPSGGSSTEEPRREHSEETKEPKEESKEKEGKEKEPKEEPPPPPPAPVDETLPAIGGSTIEGDTLTATAGTWENEPSGYVYQWRRCSTKGEGCTDIAGATTNSHKLTAGDVGHTLRVVVTATNEGGSTAATSAATAPVEEAKEEPPPPPPAPVNVTPPTIGGAATEGNTLKATAGTWENGPAAYEYQWQDCNTSGAGCTDIVGATAGTHKLTAREVGHTLRVVVTATNEGGSTAATSAATNKVAAKEKPKEEPGAELFISPSGSDSNACTTTMPCRTMNHAYQAAKAGATVRMLAGSYPEQTIEGASSKSSSAHVVFAPASGASVKVTGTIIVYASHLTIESLAIEDVTIGNFEQINGVPNPTDVTLKNLTGRNFEIDSATHITVEGGSWGPATACTEPYEGDNNAIRQPIPSQAPEYILINDTTIHDVQSANLVGCHIEGLAIFAGNHVTVNNSKFYGNSVYDVFMQANSGGNPNNVTLSGNWLATAVDTTGKNGQPVGSGDGIAVGNELSANVTVEDNHFNDVLNMNDAEEISSFSNVRVVGNVGVQPYTNYNCASLSGIEWSKNIWQNDKCSATDVNLEGAALPYVNASNNSSMNYTLTGKYANWPEESKEETKKEESGSGVLYLSPGGSDSAACTQSAPCKTLAHAYAVAKAGEKVQLAAGTYTDTSLPAAGGKASSPQVVFEPAPSAGVKFSNMLTVQAHGVELKDFTFERELEFGENAESDTARNDALHNFEIISNGTQAPKNIAIIGGTAGPVADGSDNENNLIATNGPETTAVPTKITIEGVLIHEYTKVGEAHVDCLQIWGGNEITVQGNTFERCSVFDIFLQSLPNGKAGTPKNVTIQNNLLERTIEGFYSIFLPRHNEGNQEHYENIDIRNNSLTQGIAADPRATYTNVKLDGNVAPSLLFWNEATEVDQSQPTGVETDYNVWYGPEAQKIGTHDQLAPAGFVDEATMNLHLTTGAAAIKHGDSNNYPPTDNEGNPRPNPPDAGALQYSG